MRKNEILQLGLKCLVWLLCLTAPLGMMAENNAERKTVRVGWFESVPFCYKTAQGSRAGYAYEYQQRIAAYTGWQYEYVEGDWTDLIEKLKSGEVDLLSDVTEMKEREGQMLFSARQMGTEEYYLYVRSDNEQVSRGNYEALNGKRIGVTRASYQIPLLRAWLKGNRIDAEVVELQGLGPECAQLMAEGKLDAYAGSNGFIEMSPDFLQIASIGGSSYSFAINKERMDLKRELDAAMNQILSLNPYYNRYLDQKYMPNSGISVYVSPEEKDWLDKHGSIKIGYLADYLPYCAQDGKTGKLMGFLDEFVNSTTDMLKNAPIAYETQVYETVGKALEALKKGEIDCVFPVTMSLNGAEKHGLMPTEPLVSSELFIVYNKRKNPVFKPEENHKVAYWSGHNLDDVVEENFSGWEILHYNNLNTAFQAVGTGLADCFLVRNYRLNPLQKYIDRYGLSAVSSGVDAKMCIAVRSDELALYSILERLVSLSDQNKMSASLMRYSLEDERVTVVDFVKDNVMFVCALLVLIIVIVLIVAIKSYTAQNIQKQLNMDLVVMKDASEQANRSKSIFLHNMSHDIRTPMNAILGYANLLEKQKDNPALVADYTEKIKKSGGYLLSLINSVLDMARIESGKMELDEEFMDLYDPANNVLALFEEQAKKKNLKIESSIDVMHPYVRADKMKVRQVVMNLLSNAIKYTPDGGKVTFTFEEMPTSKVGYATYVTTIRDTGVGMTKDFQDHIFEIFSRERNTTDSKVNGTGLGMSIVKKLVDLMDGTIEITSEPGKGTTIEVTLTHQIVENPEKYRPMEMPQYGDHPTGIEGRRVLLAEDNDLNVEIAIAILEDLGLKVDRAVDGVECIRMLEKADAGYYSLIFMDIQMPNMNGYDATLRIRAMEDNSKATIPILAMTANAFEEDKRRAFMSGMNGHLAKPVNVPALIAAISENLKK